MGTALSIGWDRGRSVTRKIGLWGAVLFLAAAIFVADTLTRVEVAVAVLYVAVVLLAVKGGRRAVLLAGAGCAALAMTSFLLTQRGPVGVGAANCVLSLLAIGATAVLSVRIEAASRAARQAQADLAHLSRVMVLSELTTSIAHEVSQPLAAIVANSSAAVRWLSGSRVNQDEVRLALDRIVRDAERAGAVIARVRHLIRRMPPTQESFDLTDIIEEAVGFVQSEVRRNGIQLRMDLDDPPLRVRGDRVQLQQVVLNMLLNGIEALGGVDPAMRKLSVSASAEGRQVKVSIRDSGEGVAAEAVGHVFEAFYTTKPNGIGVGLAISRSIVEAHGGAVYMAPHHPRGTDVGFTLPRHIEKEDERDA